MAIRVQTARLALRTPVPADLPFYLAYRNDPPALAAQGMEPMDEAQARAFLTAQSKRAASEPGWLMLVLELRDTGDVVGEVGVYLRDVSPGTGSIGWWLHPAWRGRGLATEAARALIEWCFDGLGLASVDAACLASNAPSHRVMQNAGLRFRRLIPKGKQVGGEWHDELEYDIVAPLPANAGSA